MEIIVPVEMFTQEAIKGVTIKMNISRSLLTGIVMLFFVIIPVLGNGENRYRINAGPHMTVLIDQDGLVIGSGEYWNTKSDFVITFQLQDGWCVKEAQIYAGMDVPPLSKKDKPEINLFTYKKEMEQYQSTVMVQCSLEAQDHRWGMHYAAIHADLVQVDADGEIITTNDLWALPATENSDTNEIEIADYEPWPGANHGGYFTTVFYHPQRGHFIDSPVAGLTYETVTHQGITDDAGGFDYFPGERVLLSIGKVIIGEPIAGQKIFPLDIFEGGDTDDPRVINMARLLQSLDADATPKDKITISPEVTDCLNQTMEKLSLTNIDFADTTQVDKIIQETIQLCTALAEVSAEDAKANLDKAVNNPMFRKNVSKTPELGSSKAKLNVMGVWLPALRANDEPAYYLEEDTLIKGIQYFDEEGNLIRTDSEAKPLVITYTDADPATGAHDVWAAISRDDGYTWKRKNISRMADRSSFILANGTPYFGHCKKPVFQVKGNKIMIAWTSKFARGGKPRYAIQTCPDTNSDGVVDPCTVCNGYDENEICETDYPYDDAYYTDDIWGVAGPQRSHDYTEEGYPEVGEVPYSAVWIVRGIVATQADVDKGVGEFIGDIIWFKPERLTSGRRDANQVFMGGADGAGFAIAWQEDPGGLRPGEAKGPGPGWGGATTNHKTDIWYSFITWGDFAKVDTHFASGGDPQHDFGDDHEGRPKPLVPMSLPVRISDNDAVNTDNMLIALDENGLPTRNADGSYTPITNLDASSEDAEGSHRYGYMLEGLWEWDGSIYYEGQDNSAWQAGSGTLYEFVNQQDETKRVVVTADGRTLDGNTGAARPNLFLQTYTKPDGSKSAWAIMAYEETKGMGAGPPETTGTGEQPQDGSGYDPYETFPDNGKNAIYHSFDFQNPDLVSAGTILNLPETDADGNPIYVVEPDFLGSTLNNDGTYTPIPNPVAGALITDWKGEPQLAYENARRPRFILQSKASAFGGVKSYDANGNPIFKKPGNSGTVLIALYKEGEEGAGRPSDIMARRCVVKNIDGIIKKGNPWSPNNFLPGTQNVSTVMPGTTWINPDRDEDAKGDGIKVCDWSQPKDCLSWKSGVNPYEDARAHRGAIRGDFVIMGYSYCPNWAASRNAHDKYDFYIRRSFDGGASWTTDPTATVPVAHTDYFFDPEGISGAELDAEGNDVSKPTKHYTVETLYGPGIYEPARNVSLIKNNKVSVIEPRVVAVPGTIKKDGVWTGIAEDKQNPNVFYIAYGTSTNLPGVEKAPEDLFLSFSQNQGTALEMDEWVVNPDSDSNNAGEMVRGWFRLAKGDQEQGEVQIRMTPDGSRFYACWLDEGVDGSDIVFRRIMSSKFPTNIAPVDINLP